MNYPLDAIDTILTAQGYTDIYIDQVFSDSSQNTSIIEAIFLVSEPTAGRDNFAQFFDFAIYVRRNDPEQARIVATNIYKYLNTFRGKDEPISSGGIKINYIETLTKPSFFGTNTQGGQTEFISRYRIQYVDLDINLY
jgi:hypothetical protein